MSCSQQEYVRPGWAAACSCQSTEWHALTSSSAWWGQCNGWLCYSSFFKYNSFVIIVKRFHLTTAPNSFVLVTVTIKMFWSWCLSNQNWFFLPSLAPTNHQTSLLLLNYFCQVPSGLSSSLLWLASEAIVTFPQPSPGAIFKTTNIFTFSCLVPEVWRVQWIWILRVRFVVLFISWGISANSFLLCQNLRRDGCSAHWTTATLHSM